MDLQHINIKIFVDGELTVGTEKLIETFHRWTSEQVMDELLIDVADYLHVPNGPGIVLVGHEADYAIDNARGRWGMLYNRKTQLAGTNIDRFHQALQSSMKACRLLEQEFSDLRFNRTELGLIVNDRALCPNTPETFESVKPDIEAFIRDVCGSDAFTLSPENEPRRRFEVSIALQDAMEFNITA